MVTQQEPLGQNITLSDPAALPDPQPNEIFIGYASSPEWQCLAGLQFYGSFSAMPFHCQFRMLTDIRNSLENIYEPAPTREDPTKVAHGLMDSPLPHAYSPDRGASFASKALMSFALTASYKEDKDKEPKAVPDIHLPEETVEVKIPAIDMTSIPGWVDASVSGRKTDAIPGFDKEKLSILGKALDEAKVLLAKPECQKELGKAGINVTDLVTKLGGLKIRPESDTNAVKYIVGPKYVEAD